MKKVAILSSITLPIAQAFGQQHPSSIETPTLDTHGVEVFLPALFITFLVGMFVTLIKYILEFRLKNKLIDRGMSEALSNYLSGKNDREKQHEVVRLALLFCGIGAGLLITYLTSPVHIHSLAIMAFSIGLSYLAYFFYLRR